jgi:hypothetical protein
VPLVRWVRKVRLVRRDHKAIPVWLDRKVQQVRKGQRVPTVRCRVRQGHKVLLVQRVRQGLQDRKVRRVIPVQRVRRDLRGRSVILVLQDRRDRLAIQVRRGRRVTPVLRVRRDQRVQRDQRDRVCQLAVRPGKFLLRRRRLILQLTGRPLLLAR